MVSCVGHQFLLPYHQDILSQPNCILNLKSIGTTCMYGSSHASLSIRKISEEVSGLTTAPRRSSSCMYDDQWLRFAGLAAEYEFDIAVQVAAFIFTFQRPGPGIGAQLDAGQNNL